LAIVKEKFGDDRRTELVDVQEEVNFLDLIADEPMVVTVSHTGYIKRVATDTYRAQGRGGRGITGATTKEKDFVEYLFVGWAHSYILVFTNHGRCHWLRVFEIPEAGRTSKGKALVNLIQLQTDEKVKAFVPVKHFDDHRCLVFATERGIINKMALSAFSNPRSSGINAINLQPGDRLIQVVKASDDQDVMIGTEQGQAIRFSMSAFRQMGRGTMGVRGIRLFGNDRAIGMLVIRDDKTILTVTENGYGKRSRPGEYRLTRRGGKGVRNMRISDKTGQVVVINAVRDDQELMIVTRNGIIIKMRVDSINILGRNTQGVRTIRLSASDAVADVEIMEAEDKLSVNGNGLNGDEVNIAENGEAADVHLSQNREEPSSSPIDDPPDSSHTEPSSDV
jgi:DNA gyrase subunit A